MSRKKNACNNKKNRSLIFFPCMPIAAIVMHDLQ